MSASTLAGGGLDGLQEWMLDALIHPGKVDGDEVERCFTASANLSPAACLGIYQRSYILRLAKCLAEQFPALCHALGDDLFDGFAREYLEVCPSDSYTLYELGRRFPDYLEDARPDRDLPAEQREGWIDFMVDLARYERLHFRLFDAPGNEDGWWPTAATPDERLALQPCFELAVSRYPVAWYYHAIKDDPDAPFPPLRTSHVAVLRRNYLVSTFPITAAQHLFLYHLRASGDVGTALARLADATANPLDDVVRSWRDEVRASWIDAGFFVDREMAGV